jgi:hypothetical protein
MGIIFIKEPISKVELLRLAEEGFGDMVKAVVDVRQEIMAVGGELHADEEVELSEREGSTREDTWGINIYPALSGEDMVEFDSMVNLKPAYGNRTRSVEDPATQGKIRAIVSKLIQNQ